MKRTDSNLTPTQISNAQKKRNSQSSSEGNARSRFDTKASELYEQVQSLPPTKVISLSSSFICKFVMNLFFQRLTLIFVLINHKIIMLISVFEFVAENAEVCLWSFDRFRKRPEGYHQATGFSFLGTNFLMKFWKRIRNWYDFDGFEQKNTKFLISLIKKIRRAPDASRRLRIRNPDTPTRTSAILICASGAATGGHSRRINNSTNFHQQTIINLSI